MASVQRPKGEAPQAKKRRGCALVTGSSRGIGKAIALELARSGWDIMVNFARDEASARTVVAAVTQHDVRGDLCQADVSRPEDRTRLVNAARDAFGKIEVLVNNAGMAPLQRKDILEEDEQAFDELIGVNLKGPFFLTQRIASLMIHWKAEDPEFKPVIVFIGSISAYATSVHRPTYCISKAGLSMVRALYAHRLSQEGIGVYEVSPGIIETDMTSPVKAHYDRRIAEGLIPQGRWGSPEDVGCAVAMLASGWLSYSTGQVIDVDGGFRLRRL